MHIIGKLKLKVAPPITAVSLAEAKDHLRVDGTDDDAYITTLINVATEAVQNYTRLQLMDATFQMFLDSFPACIDLYISPVKDITHVKYYDADNVLQTLSADDYDVDYKDSPGKIYPAANKSWPTIYNRKNAVEIQFNAGETLAANVPDAIKQAMLLIIGHYYENRLDVVNTLNRELPKGSEYLLNPYKVFEI